MIGQLPKKTNWLGTLFEFSIKIDIHNGHTVERLCMACMHLELDAFNYTSDQLKSDPGKNNKNISIMYVKLSINSKFKPLGKDFMTLLTHDH